MIVFKIFVCFSSSVISLRESRVPLFDMRTTFFLKPSIDSLISIMKTNGKWKTKGFRCRFYEDSYHTKEMSINVVWFVCIFKFLYRLFDIRQKSSIKSTFYSISNQNSTTRNLFRGCQFYDCFLFMWKKELPFSKNLHEKNESDKGNNKVGV